MGKNLRQASAAAIAKAQNIAGLNSGSKKSDFDFEDIDLSSSTLFTPIEVAAAAFIERVKLNIIDAGITVSGGINDIKIVPNGDVVEIQAPAYLKYLDKGVSGTITKYPSSPYSYTNKMPPPDVFKDWIIAKQLNTREKPRDLDHVSGNIKPQDFENTDPDSVAFAMAKSHQQHGQEPLNLYSKEIEQLVDELTEEIGNFTINLF